MKHPEPVSSQSGSTSVGSTAQLANQEAALTGVGITATSTRSIP